MTPRPGSAARAPPVWAKGERATERARERQREATTHRKLLREKGGGRSLYHRQARARRLRGPQAPLPLLSLPQSLHPAPCTLNPSPYTLNRRGGTDSHDTAHCRDQPLETRLAQPLGFRQQQERVHLRRKVDVRLPGKHNWRERGRST